MTAIPAVYENGVFRPTGPVPLAEGTPVQVTAVTAAPPEVAPPNGRQTYELLKAIAAMPSPTPEEVRARILAVACLPDEPGGDETVTSMNVDEVLYGRSGGAR